MRPHGRPRRSEGYFGPEGRRPKASIGGPASVEGVLTPISSRIISDRLDLYKGAFQSLFILYLVHHPDHSDPSDPPPPSEYEALVRSISRPCILLIAFDMRLTVI